MINNGHTKERAEGSLVIDSSVESSDELALQGDGHKKARPEGFEPPTLGSEDRCSNPLSYGRMFDTINLAQRL